MTLQRHPSFCKSWLLLFVCLAIFYPQLVDAWEGKVVGVTDGDTITVLHEGKGEKIRLYGIDCPERKQPFGTRAKQFTSDMVFGKMVSVEPVDVDRYGRTVGIVRLEDGSVLNAQIVRVGLAWVYDRFCKSPLCKEWRVPEVGARAEARGLWKDQNPVPPWEWRRSAKGSKKRSR